MGWKTLKQFFGIKHHITVEKDCINIGSGYVHDLIVINTKTGLIIKNSTFSGFLAEHYPELKKASPKKIIELIKTKDVFLRSLPVYTYNYDGDILEKQCEAYGYPNITHDGLIMYENTFSKDKNTIVSRAKRELKSAVSLAYDSVNISQNELVKRQKELASYKVNLKKLTEKHPD